MKIKQTLFILLFFSFLTNDVFGQEPKTPTFLGYGIDAASFGLTSSRFFYETYMKLKITQTMASDLETKTITTLDNSFKLLKDTGNVMGVDPNTKVIVSLPNLSGSPASAGHRVLYVSPHLAFFSAEEQQYILGHEFSHINHDDYRNNHIIAAVAPFVSFGLLRVYKACSEKIIEYWMRKKPDSRLSFWLSKVKNVNNFFANNPITHYLLTLYITNSINRRFELRADAEAAQALNVARAGITALRRTQSLEYNAALGQDYLRKYMQTLPWHTQLYVISKMFDFLLGMPTHPSDEVRIAALEKLIAK